jgi:hypothetical protein
MVCFLLQRFFKRFLFFARNGRKAGINGFLTVFQPFLSDASQLLVIEDRS